MKFPLVMVEFLDHSVVDPDYPLDEDVICYAFGLLIEETEYYYHVLMATYGDLNDSEVFKIIKGAVTDIRTFAEVEIYENKFNSIN